MYLVTLTLQTGFCDDLTCRTKFFLSTLVKGTLKRNMLLLASLSKDIPCYGKTNFFWMWASCEIAYWEIGYVVHGLAVVTLLPRTENSYPEPNSYIVLL